MTTPLYIDNSTLKAVARCSTEAALRYAYGYTTVEEAAALKAGTAFHAAMEAHFKGQHRDVALDAFIKEYDAWAREHVAADDRLAPDNLIRIVSYWLETHPLAAFPFTVDPAMVEVGFAYPLVEDGSIVFCGRLDGITEYNGALYVLEHKSTGRISKDWLGMFGMDSQLSGYIWAAQQHTGLPVVGAFLNAVEFGRLPNSDMMCRGGAGIKPHGVKYSECGHLHGNTVMTVVTRTGPELLEWHRTAVHLALRYREMLTKWPTIDHLHKLRMQGTFHGACRFCAFKDFCKMGRPLSYITAGNLIHQPWKPYDYATAQADTSGHQP